MNLKNIALNTIIHCLNFLIITFWHIMSSLSLVLNFKFLGKSSSVGLSGRIPGHRHRFPGEPIFYLYLFLSHSLTYTHSSLFSLSLSCWDTLGKYLATAIAFQVNIFFLFIFFSLTHSPTHTVSLFFFISGLWNFCFRFLRFITLWSFSCLLSLSPFLYLVWYICIYCMSRK